MKFSLTHRGSRVLPSILFALSALALSGCSDNDPAPVESAAFTLSLIHASDMEGNTNAIGDAPRFSAIVGALQARDPNNSLTVSSGDNFIPSPFFSAQDDAGLDGITGTPANGNVEGRADITMLNAMGFQVSTLGNHDFDAGPDHLADLIAADSAGAYAGAQFPFVSANLDFGAHTALNNLLTTAGANPLPNSIAPSVVIDVNGTSIGIVGAVTNSLASITSLAPVAVNGGSSNSDLAAAIQPAIDALTNQGITHIVLLTHFQNIDIERDVITLLSDVDIVVGGGSDSIFADTNDRLRTGDSASGEYPEFITSADGSPTALVNTDGQYRYVGYLRIGFNADGVIIPSTVDSTVSGAYAADDQGVIDVNGVANATVTQIASVLGTNINGKDGNLFGNSSVFLNGLRASVRNQETNLGNLTADANLFAAQQVISSTAISLKNGGGIRAEMGRIEIPPGATDPSQEVRLPPPENTLAGKNEGDVSQLEIETSLAFNNGLKTFTVTGRELVALLEHGIANAGATDGRFPQVGGIQFSYDPSQPGIDFDTAGLTIAGVTIPSRIQKLLVLDSNGAQAGGSPVCIVNNGAFVAGQDSATFDVVALDFLFDNDGDGYPFSQIAAVGAASDLTGTGLANADFTADGSEQDAFAEYMLANFPSTSPFNNADTDEASDTRIIRIGTGTDVITCP